MQGLDAYGFPVTDGAALPWLTAAQMRAADRLAVERYGIDLPRMMELAGRHLAELARRRFLQGDPRGRAVAVLAGSGGNGGGVLVAARRLACWGAHVSVWCTRPPQRSRPLTAAQARILERVGVGISDAGAPAGAAEVVLEGVLGYSLSGAPRGRAAELIEYARRQPAPVLSLDVPAGLDCERGVLLEPAVRAAATLALALPKRGLRGLAEAGELYLGDLGWPPALFALEPLGLRVHSPFHAGDLLRVG